MVDLLGNLTEDDCNADKVLFDHNEVVEFAGKDYRVDDKKGHIFLRCDVLTGANAGREHTIMIAGGDSDMAKKQRARFFFKSGFWSQEEINSKNIQMSKISGQKFSGKATKVREVDGEKYQNIIDIRYLGPVHQVQQVAQPAAAPQPAPAATAPAPAPAQPAQPGQQQAQQTVVTTPVAAAQY